MTIGEERHMAKVERDLDRIAAALEGLLALLKGTDKDGEDALG